MTNSGVIGSAGSSLSGVPETKLGWWAAGLGAAFIFGFVLNSILAGAGVLDMGSAPPAVRITYAVVLLGVGLAAGVTSIVAMTRKHERSWMLWLAVMVAAFVILFVTGEFLLPH